VSPDFLPLIFSLTPQQETVPPSPSPVTPNIDPEVKKAVRDLLRYGGYKPSGRGRPASESLLKAYEAERYPSIHPVVDYFNGLSLETGLPISVLDQDKLSGEWGFRLGQSGEVYTFNPSGQELKVEGLPVLADESGPTGSPVKDAQRTKVGPETSRYLVVVWGTSQLPDLNDRIETAVAERFQVKPLSRRE